MKRYNIHEAKTHLSRIVARVVEGESVIIGKAGTPVAILSPYVDEAVSRKPGTMKGRIQIADDFDAEDVLITQLFEGVEKEATEEQTTDEEE